MNKPLVSVIIVNYKVKEELFECIESIKKNTYLEYEIIVVDNDEEKKLGSELDKKFPKVKYIKTKKNIGFGAGNNLGVKHAKGDYLFFLNPDTLIQKRAIEELVNFIKKDKKIGAVSPLLLYPDMTPMPQGSQELTPIRGIFSQSFINKLFPNNFVSKAFWLKKWKKDKDIRVGVVPGTAFLIRKNTFREIGGFDENFFLYFEENDLSRRLIKKGFELFITTKSKVVHLWERSTVKYAQRRKIFSQSRFYYFKKHFGIPKALLVQFLSELGSVHLLLIATLLISAFANLYKIETFMPFIGDQGWFYLSAREMVVEHEVSLVGITASHTWLHQGPFWTYMLAVIFWLFGFNPVNGAYLSAGIGILTVFAVYLVTSSLFSRKIGLVSAFLYAVSPLVIMLSRMPYHTTPIPLFSLLLMFSVFKWIKGNVYYFPLSVFFLVVLYNFELAAFVFFFILFFYLVFGIIKKKSWACMLKKPKLLLISVFSFLVPMLPILIYDFNNNFSQTLKFGVWIIYRSFTTFGTETYGVSFLDVLNFLGFNYQRLVFIENGYVALLIFLFTLAVLFKRLKEVIKEKNYHEPLLIVLIFILVPFIGFLANRVPSDAYLPVFYPFVIIAIGYAISIIKSNKSGTVLIAVILISIGYFNLLNLFSHSFYVAPSMSQRIKVSEKIIQESNGESFAIRGSGPGSQFESYTMNYEYILKWLGTTPRKESNLIFQIEDRGDIIKLERIEK